MIECAFPRSVAAAWESQGVGECVLFGCGRASSAAGFGPCPALRSALSRSASWRLAPARDRRARRCSAACCSAASRLRATPRMQSTASGTVPGPNGPPAATGVPRRPSPTTRRPSPTTVRPHRSPSRTMRRSIQCSSTRRRRLIRSPSATLPSPSRAASSTLRVRADHHQHVRRHGFRQWQQRGQRQHRQQSARPHGVRQ